MVNSGSAEDAVKICTEYAENGNREAMGMLAYMYRDGTGTEADLDKAIFWMQRAYELKLPSARMALSELLERRARIDSVTAFKLCKDESRKECPRALFHLAHMYRDGIGCNVDQKKYCELLDKAYVCGSVSAGLELIKLLSKTKTPKDCTKAFRICKELTEKGEVKAAGLLGQMYRDGTGCRVDRDKAVEYLKIAASADLEWARNDLRDLLIKG